MLPMPGSWTVSPDDTFKIPFTRGTRDWAPPRAQIIFTRHPTTEYLPNIHNLKPHLYFFYYFEQPQDPTSPPKSKVCWLRNASSCSLFASLQILRVLGQISLYRLSSKSNLFNSGSGLGPMGVHKSSSQRFCLSFTRSNLDISAVPGIGSEQKSVCENSRTAMLQNAQNSVALRSRFHYVLQICRRVSRFQNGCGIFCLRFNIFAFSGQRQFSTRLLRILRPTSIYGQCQILQQFGMALLSEISTR